ncbi:hypothetical protein [Listeria booriae]|uniref:hypothetical protein n=1 Tax=Listeria booriae TaxID=1552123 RepID=UPI00162554DC|nr:hypothetical protein [Listeria booriae]MBC1212451.1 hypothetical protein [Listeria booriae]MBC1309327.1 hypothetical protein [Listeria booriae]
MNSVKKEEIRKQAQFAFESILIGNQDKRLVHKVSITAFDQEHSIEESLAMRLEVIAGIPLDTTRDNRALVLQSDYIAVLSTVGTKAEQRAYLDNEVEMLEKLAKHPILRSR